MTHKDTTLKAHELENNDDLIVLGSQSQVSPTSSVCSVASSILRRSTRKTRLSLEHGSSEANESEDTSAPTAGSLLTRSLSDRKYNLRKKCGKDEASEGEASLSAGDGAVEAKSKRTKSRTAKLSNEADSASSHLFSIHENESNLSENKCSSLRSRSKESK